MKTIKFSLPMQKPDPNGKYPVTYVSSLEELRDNFDPQGLLYALEHNNLLTRWLECRGYDYELDQVKKLQANTDLQVRGKVNELAKIFEIDMPETELNQLLTDIEVMAQNKAFIEKQISHISDIDQVIRNSCKRYQEVVKNIIDHPKDLSTVRNNVYELSKTHFVIVSLDFNKLFVTLQKQAPLALLCMIADKKLRPLFLDFDFNGRPYKTSFRQESNSKFSAGLKYVNGSYLDQFEQLFYQPREDLEQLIGPYVRCASLSDEWKTFEPDSKLITCFIYRDYNTCNIRPDSDDASERRVKEYGVSFDVLKGLQAKLDYGSGAYLYYVVLN